ncbi:MAG: ankyrin repeat domain-containing protein [Planctomycetaceae bacterium]|nr:ankyrin repeat domain-containing protein [Planctomycetaceae bacterium]
MLSERAIQDGQFMESIKKGDFKFVREFLKNDPDSLSRLHKKLPIHSAFFSEDPKMVQLMLDHGADLEQTDSRDGLTPLLAVSKYKNAAKMAKVLIAAGARIEARDRLGRTPLFHAIMEQTDWAREAIKVFKRHGAKEDVSIAAIQADLPKLKKFVAADPNAIRNQPVAPHVVLGVLVGLDNGSQQNKADCIDFLFAHGFQIAQADFEPILDSARTSFSKGPLLESLKRHAPR